MLPANCSSDGDQLVVSRIHKREENLHGRSVGRRSHPRLHDGRAGSVGGAAIGRSRGGRHQDRAARGRYDARAGTGAQSRHGRLLSRLQSFEALDCARPQAGGRPPGALQAGRDRRRHHAQLPARARQAPRRRVREVREDQPAHRLSRDLRLSRRRPDGIEGRVRRHHPGRVRARRAADRRCRTAALPADHRRRQDQFQRRRLGAAGGPVRAGAHRQGPVGRSADVRDARILRHGRASLRRDL